MKVCQVCHTVNHDLAAHCRACGESSFSAAIVVASAEAPSDLVVAEAPPPRPESAPLDAINHSRRGRRR